MSNADARGTGLAEVADMAAKLRKRSRKGAKPRASAVARLDEGWQALVGKSLRGARDGKVEFAWPDPDPPPSPRKRIGVAVKARKKAVKKVAKKKTAVKKTAVKKTVKKRAAKKKASKK